MILCFKKFWERFIFYIYTIKKYWECWGLMRQGLAGGRKAKRKGKWILYYIIILLLLLYIYMYLLTFCHFLQTRGGFLPSVFFFLIASVEAVSPPSPPSPPSPHLPPNSRNFANPQCLPNKINNLTKFSSQRSCATLQHPKNSQKTLTKSIT